MLEVLLGIAVYTLILSGLVVLILLAKSILLSDEEVAITINGRKTIQVHPGDKLSTCLADAGIYVSSACGGGGSCGQCTLKVFKGGGGILPTETSHITKRRAREGERLACQVTVHEPMEIEVAPEAFESRKWKCRVRSNRNVSLFIKELVLELPEGESVDFKAGGYIQIEVPPHELDYRDFDVEEPYAEEWTRRDIWRFHSKVTEPATRAYSMASYPGEKGLIILNIRIAFPPPGSPPEAVPGKASSWLFNLKENDEVTISGPFGHFFINESDSEMIYIGGGSGMAPLRSHILELLRGRNSQRKITYWFNVRNLQEAFYLEDFEALEREFPNFTFHLALFHPNPEDNWTGPTGFPAKILYKEQLRDHPAPEDVEYYMCGPWLMTQSILRLLDDLGVEEDNIFFDNFGS